jgi:hypothetical protein
MVRLSAWRRRGVNSQAYRAASSDIWFSEVELISAPPHFATEAIKYQIYEIHQFLTVKTKTASTN